MIQTVNVNVAAQPTSGGPESFLVLSQNENGRQIRFRVLGDDLPARKEFITAHGSEYMSDVDAY